MEQRCYLGVEKQADLLTGLPALNVQDIFKRKKLKTLHPFLCSQYDRDTRDGRE